MHCSSRTGLKLQGIKIQIAKSNENKKFKIKSLRIKWKIQANYYAGQTPNKKRKIENRVTEEQLLASFEGDTVSNEIFEKVIEIF